MNTTVKLSKPIMIYCTKCERFRASKIWDAGKYICHGCGAGNFCKNKVQLSNVDKVSIYEKSKVLIDAGIITASKKKEDAGLNMIIDEFKGSVK